MYDVTSERSFLSLRDWITSIREHSVKSRLKMSIIGNKVDLIRNDKLLITQRKAAKALAEVIQISND